MINLRTNVSSLIAQNSLTQSTNKLNLAIERMTTGYKINHASDNAANYSIANNMQTQLSAYAVAQDNIAMGLDLVSTAQDTMALMQDHGSRIRSLVTQGLNGTYGNDSMQAIASEINARVAEIGRLYKTTEYNGTKLFNNMEIPEVDASLPQAGANGFINSTANQVEYSASQVASMTSVSSVTGNYTSGTKYKISSEAELIKLANDVNSGVTHTGAIFVLAEDLDLSGIDWTPIGDNHTESTSSHFRGTFNGNGHTISNLTINNSGKDYQGLFGVVTGGTIKNVNMDNVSVVGKNKVGAITGQIDSTSNAIIENCTSSGSVSGNNYVGGIAGYISKSKITNSYSNANISGLNQYVGGICGIVYSSSIAEKCYATGDVSGLSGVGGLTGSVRDNGQVVQSFATGNVVGKAFVGGLTGVVMINSSVDKSYSTGFVSGDNKVGGLIGYIGCHNNMGGNVTISNSASYSFVSGYAKTGSFIGMYGKHVEYPLDYEGTHGSQFSYDSVATITNCKSIMSEGLEFISGVYNQTFYNDGADENIIDTDYDISSLTSNISEIETRTLRTLLQVGINSDDSCQLGFDTNFMYGLSAIAASGRVNSGGLCAIDNFMTQLSKKMTELGAITNRLDSALESSGVNIENLTSSLSTIKDADIGKVSSEYIRQQILQQACSTLLSTANQTPSIALQLL